MRDDHRRRGTADDAAYIAHHVVAHGRHLVGILQQTDGFPRALFLVGSHGVEGLGVCRRNGHADHVEHDAQADEHGQHQRRHNVSRALQGGGGEKAQQRRQHHRQREHPQGPAPAAFLFPAVFVLAPVAFAQE